MNAFDPLEAELVKLAPREASREFKQRVILGLRDRTPDHTRKPLLLSAACGLAAACLMAILLWWQGDVRSQREQIVTQPGTVRPVEVTHSPPTVLAYRHVLARSPEALIAMLDKHSTSILPPDPVQARLYAFRRSDMDSFD